MRLKVCGVCICSREENPDGCMEVASRFWGTSSLCIIPTQTCCILKPRPSDLERDDVMPRGSTHIRRTIRIVRSRIALFLTRDAACQARRHSGKWKPGPYTSHTCKRVVAGRQQRTFGSNKRVGKHFRAARPNIYSDYDAFFLRQVRVLAFPLALRPATSDSLFPLTSTRQMVGSSKVSEADKTNQHEPLRPPARGEQS